MSADVNWEPTDAEIQAGAIALCARMEPDPTQSDYTKTTGSVAEMWREEAAKILRAVGPLIVARALRESGRANGYDAAQPSVPRIVVA